MRVLQVKTGRWQVVAACRDSGKCELLEFLDGLPANMQAWRNGILALMDLASSDPRGPYALSREACHEVGDGIWEFIRGRIRVLWFEHKGNIVVCTHGFIKKGQKTPASERDRATATRDRVKEEGLRF